MNHNKTNTNLSKQDRNSLDYVRNSLIHTREVLAIPEVRKKLGDYAAHLSGVMYDATPVDVYDGTVEMGHIGGERLAVAALGLGEQAMRATGSYIIDDRQVQSLEREHGTERTLQIKMRQRDILDRKSPGQLPALGEELGYISSKATSVTDTHKLINRPLLVLNRDISNLPYADAPLILHEMTHVHQMRREPLFRYDHEYDANTEDVSHELEAYHVTAMTILGIMEAGREREFLSSMPSRSMSKTIEIETIRRENADLNNPFKPNKNIIRGLVDNELRITKVIEQIIKDRKSR